MFKIVEYTNVQIIHVRQKLRLQAADSLIFFVLFCFVFGGFLDPWTCMMSVRADVPNMVMFRHTVLVVCAHNHHSSDGVGELK